MYPHEIVVATVKDHNNFKNYLLNHYYMKCTVLNVVDVLP